MKERNFFNFKHQCEDFQCYHEIKLNYQDKHIQSFRNWVAKIHYNGCIFSLPDNAGSGDLRTFVDNQHVFNSNSYLNFLWNSWAHLP